VTGAEEGLAETRSGSRTKRSRQSLQPGDLSHNLLGQRLGRKGRDTRDRILAATEALLARRTDAPISLSAVAREASLGMTTLYLYFSDLTELMLAVLEPIMATAEESYVGHLRTRWPDEQLAEHCRQFVSAYHAFWQRHSSILHLRNSYADARDARMAEQRVNASQPLIDLLVGQMDSDDFSTSSPARGMATALLTGIERIVTIATDPSIFEVVGDDRNAYLNSLLEAEGRLLELGIRDRRPRS
jgi:AcrR family transcriptional regulator